MENDIMLAYSYIGKEIEGYGKVKAITIYDEDHVDRISFCFYDKDGWNETSMNDCLKL